ncbi:MAG: hypothetical protein E7220_02135 [Clostridiales bacterium]|nr:hypothetical protein [Clostridiales bacterium]
MTRQTSIDKHISQFSWIRVIACFAIVVLHTVNSGYVYYADNLGPGEAAASRITVALLMWAVPCFLMVTGALLLDPEKEITAKKLFGKYIRRVLLALIAFSFLFQVLSYIAGENTSIFGPWLSALLQCKGWPHMWYLYLMTGLYLMMPFYKMITERASDRMLWYLIGLIVLFTSLAPIAGIFGKESGFYIPTSVIYPAYLFVGYMLHRKNIRAHYAVILMIVSTALIIAASVYDKSASGGTDLSHLTGYASPFVVMQSAALFSLMERIKTPAGELLKSMDSCTFGIYLIHMIGCRLVMKWMGFDPYGFGPFGFAGLAVVFFLLSYVITWVLRRIPAVRSIV